MTYGTGGRWGEWSSGGGSSLELIDPHSNHRLAANWADSDETQKSSWVDIENTGVLDNGANYDPSIDYAQIGLLDAGECLVDNIEVDYNGTNYVSNGTFESGTERTGRSRAAWSVEPGKHAVIDSGHSLHIRCSDRIWTGVNSCQVALNANPMVGRPDGHAAFQGALAPRLAGSAAPFEWQLARSHGGDARSDQPRHTGRCPTANTSPMPGRPFTTSPTIPTVPAASQPVVVTAKVHDPDGVQSLTLYYRLDPATSYTAVTDEGQRHGRRRHRGRRRFQRDHSRASRESNRRVLHFRHGQPGRGNAVSGRCAPMTMNRCANAW